MSEAVREHVNPVEFIWSAQPAPATWLSETLLGLIGASPMLARFSARLRDESGTRLVDFLDEVVLGWDAALQGKLEQLGFAEVRATDGRVYFKHPKGLFPLISLSTSGSRGVVVRVDSVVDFALVHRLGQDVISGDAGALVREATVFSENGVELRARERHGSVLEPFRVERLDALVHHRQALRLRPRPLHDVEAGFAEALRLIALAKRDLGASYVADLFFDGERAFWQSRNHAGRIQYARQDALGLGWANHDHHTYRSSRHGFRHLIAALEALGLYCRERFYAGREAGWGAQVLEHRELGIAVFADVDMSAAEVTGDFAHLGFAPADTLGTVGLWARLHGEAFLAAGMHHLECQFDFDAVTTQLAAEGVQRMAPFTNFSYLRQAFTQGEWWPVAPEAIEQAEREGHITKAQADLFRKQGAIGSHLEILERNDGYKGFNQTGISDIILKTDPRLVVAH